MKIKMYCIRYYGSKNLYWNGKTTSEISVLLYSSQEQAQFTVDKILIPDSYFVEEFVE